MPAGRVIWFNCGCSCVNSPMYSLCFAKKDTFSCHCHWEQICMFWKFHWTAQILDRLGPFTRNSLYYTHYFPHTSRQLRAYFPSYSINTNCRLAVPTLFGGLVPYLSLTVTSSPYAPAAVIFSKSGHAQRGLLFFSQLTSLLYARLSFHRIFPICRRDDGFLTIFSFSVKPFSSEIFAFEWYNKPQKAFSGLMMKWPFSEDLLLFCGVIFSFSKGSGYGRPPWWCLIRPR